MKKNGRTDSSYGLENPKVLAAKLATRKATPPLTVIGVGPPKSLVIPATRLDELGIADYQRKEERSEVNDLIHAMVAGGEVPDLIKLVRRTDDSLWIVDGQQRWWAHKRLQRPVHALVYTVADYETEARLYNVFNTHRTMSANYRVRAWQGESAELLRRLDTKSDSPFYQQIDLGGGHGRRFSAATLIRMMNVVAADSANRWGGKIDVVLAVTDFALAKGEAFRERAQVVVHLAARVFDPEATDGIVRHLPAIGLAQVAREKWLDHGRVICPTPAEIRTIGRIQWQKAFVSAGAHHLPSAMNLIRRRWKSA